MQAVQNLVDQAEQSSQNLIDQDMDTEGVYPSHTNTDLRGEFTEENVIETSSLRIPALAHD